MVLRHALLIPDDRPIWQQIEFALRFMGLDVEMTQADALNADALSPGTAATAFVLVADATESAFVKLAEIHRQIPIILVDEEDHAASPRLQTLAAARLLWPSTHGVVSECLDKIGSGDRTVTVRAPELFRSLVGKSAAICRMRELMQRVAGSDSTVLVLGESGTGKEVVARNLHYYSPRRQKPFVPINCGAIPAELLESELFGHEKGAFTGALSSRQGRFEMAEGGTLFLDEIGDMPMAMQVKLLRVLQERTFERVGSNKTIQCDVRVIAATHRNLEDEIQNNRFREDLYYRLNVFPIEVPALRDRTDDIPMLVDELAARLRSEKKPSVRLTPAVIRTLQKHHWPGNVRELANLVERLAIMHPNGVADLDDMPEKFRRYAPSLPTDYDTEDADDAIDAGMAVLAEFAGGLTTSARLPQDGLDLREHLSNLECELIRQALDECNGVVAHAANLLRMRRTTLVEKLRKYGLRSEETSIS